MRSILDWVLEKMRLVDDGVVEEEEVERGESQHILFKNIWEYDDCKEIIDNYKSGGACIFRLIPGENADAQGMMNYICGGIYALGGEITEIGGNMYMALPE